MKLLLILACLAMAVRSGPLPACLWDEAFESMVSADGSSSNASTSIATNGVQIVLPSGDDTPEQIAQDQILQQSMGHLQQSCGSLHDGTARDGIHFVACSAVCDLHWHTPTAFGSVPLPRELPATSPPSQYRPLLI